ncbi:MAG: hypothetical protein ABR499_03060 [Gemmatimonadaceae bacterium]
MPSFLASVRSFWRNLFSRAAVERDLDDELRATSTSWPPKK